MGRREYFMISLTANRRKEKSFRKKNNALRTSNSWTIRLPDPGVHHIYNMRRLHGGLECLALAEYWTDDPKARFAELDKEAA